MAHNIALKKSAQSVFTRAVKNIRPLIKKNDLKNRENNAAWKGKGKKIVLGKEKEVGQQTNKSTWKPLGRGVVLLRHIPPGFHEEEMSSYFNQFGRVTRLNLVRSKKTGNPRGYAFIEFLYSEVAQVVAETMNNYLMCGRLLKAEYIPGDHVSRGMFSNANIRPGNCPRSKHQKKVVEKTNRKLLPTEEVAQFQKRNKRLEKIKRELEKSGIQLDCQIEGGVTLLNNGALNSERMQNPILEIDESDDEIDFKVHPNVTKVIKRKSVPKSSPSAKKMKTEAVQNVARTQSSPRKIQGINMEMKDIESLENQSGKRHRKHTLSSETSPVSTPEKKKLTLLQGLKTKKGKGESPSTSLNSDCSPGLTPLQESKSKRRKSTTTPSISIKHLDSISEKISLTPVSKSSPKCLSESPFISAKKLKGDIAKITSPLLVSKSPSSPLSKSPSASVKKLKATSVKKVSTTPVSKSPSNLSVSAKKLKNSKSMNISKTPLTSPRLKHSAAKSK